MGDAKGISRQLRSLLPEGGSRIVEIMNLSAFPGKYQENVFATVKTRPGARWRGHEYVVLQIPKNTTTAKLKDGDIMTELPERTSNSGIISHAATGILFSSPHDGLPIDNTAFHRLLVLMERHKREDAAAKSNQ